MKQYQHPCLNTVGLAEVMQALSDPCRLGIVRSLLEWDGKELACNEFDMDVAKATRSHHFEVLRDAGLIQSRMEGTKCMTSLRREEIERKFPGLIELLLGTE